MNTGFTLLWGKILESSIWVKETKETRLVWITMLAMKDRVGRVQASVVGLADRAKVSVAECRKALEVLMSPDPDDTSKVEEGRRLREIPGGWEIVNHDLYRFSTDELRELWRRQKADQRARKKAAMDEAVVKERVKEEATLENKKDLLRLHTIAVHDLKNEIARDTGAQTSADVRPRRKLSESFKANPPGQDSAGRQGSTDVAPTGPNCDSAY
jgi:hypothetical protein